MGDRSAVEREVLKHFRVMLYSLHRQFQEVERVCGVTGSQLWALSYVAANPGAQTKALAREMIVHSSTATRLVERLVGQGLMTCARDASNQRSNRLVVTKAGRKVLSKAPGPFQGMLPDALSRLPQSALDTLHMTLQTLVAQIQAADSPPLQTERTVPFQCPEVGRRVPVLQTVESASGSGDDGAKPVILNQVCTLADYCPKIDRCPVRRGNLGD